MNSFDQCSTVAAKSLAMLHPFLEETQGRYVVTDKGRLAPYLQSVVGDLIFNDRAGRMWTVELKADATALTNVFLETWSNRNLDDLGNRHAVGRKPGWLLTLNADLLFYHFINQDKLLVANLPALQRWAFCAPSRNMSEPINGRGDRVRLQGRLWDFREVRQAAYEQKNDTRGRPVPVPILLNEVEPAPKLLSVRQLSLDLFRSEVA